MPFELLTPTAAMLSTVTPRTEVHGEDRVVAISLALKLTGANTLLDRMSPTLRPTLYQAVEGQDQLPGVEPATPLLRTKGIEQVVLSGALEGWTLTVAHGIDEDDPITLGGCKVDKFRVVPHEGGSVDLHFRVGTNDVDAEEIGLLCGKLQTEIEITLKAPEAPAPVIDGSVEAFRRDHPETGDEPTAEDLFAAAVGEDDGPGAGDSDATAGRARAVEAEIE